MPGLQIQYMIGALGAIIIIFYILLIISIIDYPLPFQTMPGNGDSHLSVRTDPNLYPYPDLAFLLY